MNRTILQIRFILIAGLICLIAGGGRAGADDVANFQTIPGALPAQLDTDDDVELSQMSSRALEAALRARQAYFKQAGLDALATQALDSPGPAPAAPPPDTGLAADLLEAGLTSIAGTSDEPTGEVTLPVDLSQSCPGFYILRTHPGANSQSGRIGAEILLAGTGLRTLQGGLNFGGQATSSIRGFSAFSIANANDEDQVVNIGLDADAPGQLVLERRSGGTATILIDRAVAGGETDVTATVSPGFYVVGFKPDRSSPTNYSVAALTSFTDRAGGGFQGGVVFGGYHNPARQSTGFGGFCIAESFDVTAKVLSQPTYGSSGAQGLAFSVSSGDGSVYLDSRTDIVGQCQEGPYAVGGPCSPEVISEQIATASDPDSLEEALRAGYAAGTGLDGIPPDLEDFLSEVAADVTTDANALTTQFLTIEQAHELALTSVGRPSLESVISVLQQQLDNYNEADSTELDRLVVLMFGETDVVISDSTRLTLLGSLLYREWLFRSFPESTFISSLQNSQQTLCRTGVLLAEANAIGDVVFRNLIVGTYRVTNVILNTVEVVAACGTGGLGEGVGIVLDAAKDCGIDTVVDFVEVEADEYCVANVEPPVQGLLGTIGSCGVAALPCVGDAWSVAVNANGVRQAVENSVNGVCQIRDNHNEAFSLCSGCDEPSFTPACGILKEGQSLGACFNPLEATPIVTCPDAPTPGETFSDCADCPTMVQIPAGSFVQGSPPNEPERSSNEGPQRTVNVPAFAMGQTEVTFDQWDACVADDGCAHNPSDEGWGRGDRPVINVSWYRAQQYVTWLSNRTGENYRLPSESEWEYATRAGTTGRFNTGNCITTDQANFDGTLPAQGCPTSIDPDQTIPVASFAPNAFGLYDTHGNVWEWVEDCRNQSYAGAPTDGSAWTSGDCDRAIIRGGSWSSVDDGSDLRSANRSANRRSNRYDNNHIGFRVARSVLP